MARMEPMADASLPDMRARMSPGTAIAAMIAMIEMTSRSSISVNPRSACLVLIDASFGSHVLRNSRAREVLVDRAAVVRAERARARLTLRLRVRFGVVGRLRRAAVAGCAGREHVRRVHAVADVQLVAALDDLVRVQVGADE